MSWEPSSIFLIIFVVSLSLTLISFAMGVAHLSIPHLGHDFGSTHVDAGPLHLPIDVGHGPVHAPLGHIHVGDTHGGVHLAGDPGLSPFNMATILAFLTWFGGAGFILTAYFSFAAVVALAGAALIGLVGAAGVFLFLAKVLVPGQTPALRPEDYDLDGTMGELTGGIRPGGTGEMVYTQAGRRFVAAARSEDGSAMNRGAEVVVVRHEDGILYVQTLEQLLGDERPDVP